LGWDGELIFTSGASEAAALAFDKATVIHEAVSAVEHDALHRFVAEGAAEIPVLKNGRIDLSAVEKTCAKSVMVADDYENRTLVAIQHVNSETGTVQDVAEIAAIVHEAGGLVLSDCAQSAGKMPLPDGLDMAIISAHKFGGPIGVGALLVKDFAMLKPSGGHERGYRRGTENLPGVLGMAAALECDPWVGTQLSDRSHFSERFEEQDPLGHTSVSHIVPITHPKISAQALLIRLDAMGFAVSAGSACASGSLKPSRVLKAFGVDDEIAARTIRVSIGWSTSPQELDAFADAWAELARNA